MTDLLNWIDAHPGTAAWVQAVGAIFALGVAILVPALMARSADRLNRRRFLESIAAIAGAAQECFANAAMHCGDEERGRGLVSGIQTSERFSVASAAINSIPVYRLAGFGLTLSVIELQRMMAEGLKLQQMISTDQETSLSTYGGAFGALADRAYPHRQLIERSALSLRSRLWRVKAALLPRRRARLRYRKAPPRF